MIKARFLMVVAAIAATTLMGVPVSAAGLKVAPLEYKATLKENERKQGFVDVSNPSSQAVSVRSSVQAFRQINDDGGLQFYSDAQTESAIKTDISTFELGPREAVRVFFSIDAKGLPEGDVYAALFFSTEPVKPTNGVGQQVRVGTILSIINQTPGSRNAVVSSLSLPLLQLSDTLKGEYRIKNTGPKNTGFYPTVEVSSWPNGEARQIEGPLVFGGRERTSDLSYRTGYGIHRIDVRYGQSTSSRWVIAIAPWMIVAALLLLVVTGIELLLLKRRRKSLNKI